MQPFVIVKIIVVREDGQILALRRSASDTRRPLQWDFPGGFVEEGEELRAAVLREAREEAGLALADAQLVFGMSEAETAVNRSGTWLVFMAHVTGAPDITLSFEHDRYKWFTPGELHDTITYDRQKKMLAYLRDTGLLVWK